LAESAGWQGQVASHGPGGGPGGRRVVDASILMAVGRLVPRVCILMAAMPCAMTVVGILPVVGDAQEVPVVGDLHVDELIGELHVGGLVDEEDACLFVEGDPVEACCGHLAVEDGSLVR